MRIEWRTELLIACALDNYTVLVRLVTILLLRNRSDRSLLHFCHSFLGFI